jgi:hypothetical protein
VTEDAGVGHGAVPSVNLRSNLVTDCCLMIRIGSPRRPRNDSGGQYSAQSPRNDSGTKEKIPVPPFLRGARGDRDLIVKQ